MATDLLTTLLFLINLTYATGATQQILASPQNQILPLNSVAKFTCTTTGLLVWNINNVQLSSAIHSFHMRGIRVDGENKSVLLVNATLRNNETRIRCLTGPSDTELNVMSEIAFLTVFGYPLSPSNLTRLSLEPFTVSWLPPFTFPGVTLTYFVNVTNLNISRVFRSGELRTQSFNFSGTEDASPCDVYQFTVTARNAAGWSEPSDTFTASLPSLPGNVNDVNHSVVMSGEDTLVKITFQPASACAEYPVTRYSLSIGSSDVNQTAMMLGPYTPNGALRIEIVLNSTDGIYQNAHYHFQISAVNIIGSSTSSGMEIYTTDVQSAEVHFDDNLTVAVACHFAEGSQALGCHVQLSFTSDSHTQNISRENGSLIAHQLIKTHFPSHCYQSQLYVYDWESDGTMGMLPVPVGRMFSEDASETCRTVPPATGPAKPEPMSNAAVIATVLASILGSMALMIVLGLIVGVVVILAKRVQSKRVATKQSVEDSNRPERHSMNNCALVPSSSPSRQTPETIFYDTPITKTQHSEGAKCERDYNTLLHSSESHNLSLTPSAEQSGLYAHLHAVPEYAVLEKDSAPMPISTSPRSSASPTPPPLPPPLSTSPPSSSPPPPPSFPPPSPSQLPPVYSEIQSLPHCQSATVNQYMEIQSAGTTIY